MPVPPNPSRPWGSLGKTSCPKHRHSRVFTKAEQTRGRKKSETPVRSQPHNDKACHPGQGSPRQPTTPDPGRTLTRQLVQV